MQIEFFFVDILFQILIHIFPTKYKSELLLSILLAEYL